MEGSRFAQTPSQQTPLLHVSSSSADQTTALHVVFCAVLLRSSPPSHKLQVAEELQLFPGDLITMKVLGSCMLCRLKHQAGWR